MSSREKFPLAYHITWGTYGTRLHGDERGTVDRTMNNFGDPIIGREEDWHRIETDNLRFPIRVLTLHQQAFVERMIPEICARGGWEFVTTAAAPDHVHQVLRAAVDGKDVRKWLKRWISEAMSAKWPLLPEQVWWAECGSVKWIWTDEYFKTVVDYVRNQRATR